MTLTLIILVLILIFLVFFKKEKFQQNLDLFFSKDELQAFAKYKKFSKILKIPQGQITYCDSKIIEEIPQITWNGYFLNNLVVYPNFRRKGYGKLLLKEIIKKGKKEGNLHLISQVKGKNIAAKNLHEKMGFRIYFRGLNEKNEEVIVYVYYF